MSSRNTTQGKARRRAERERRRRSMTPGQGPGAVELLETTADPDDFGGLDPGDAGLQATLTVLAVLADDIVGETGDAADLGDIAGETGDVAEVADDLAGSAAGLEVPGGPEDLGDPETGQPSAEAGGADEE